MKLHTMGDWPGLMLVAMLSLCPAAHAGDPTLVTVTTVIDRDEASADPGMGAGLSLREALTATNAGIIRFAPELDGKTLLLHEKPTLFVTRDVEITAFDLPNGATIVQDYAGAELISIMLIHSCTVTLCKLTFEGGLSTGGGGAIAAVSASLILEDSVFRSNTGGYGGGAIWGTGYFYALRTSFANNSSFGPDGGGAVYWRTGSGRDPRVYMQGCTFSVNTSTSNGGALAISHNGSPTFTSRIGLSTFSDNRADLDGGAIAINGDGESPIAIASCTVSGNRASGRRGGISLSSHPLELRDSIVAGNPTASGVADLHVSPAVGPINRTGNNLIGVNDGVASAFPVGSPNPNGDYVGYSQNPLDARLLPLDDNGGSTSTMLKLLNSPARDTATTPGRFPRDQRGITRPLGAGYYIGAVEAASFSLSLIESSNGMVSAFPDRSLIAAGEVATLTATPDPGFDQLRWTGDASGRPNPLAETMRGPRTIGPDFIDKAADQDQDGLLNGEELHLHGSDPLNPDSDSDTLGDGDEDLAGADTLRDDSAVVGLLNTLKLAFGQPVLTRSAVDGSVTLKVGLEETDNLTDWWPRPLDPEHVTIDADGRLELRFFPPRDGTHFFRLLESER